ncbi:cbb3-type cytochrome c oxidase subunit I [Candidatus Leptofilum sp.]|uniref:cbb3-type cytochrome c oxidase subunit I n=1 Tax=Candidatus Leptofilum sp. TaxID=3241576 RepID=UPI003B58B7A9
MATIAVPQPQDDANFRTCPVTALKVDLAAEKLIIANAVAAVVFLAIGGLFALLLALTRWQAIHLLNPVWFYRILTAHGFDMLVCWIVFFEVAGLYFGSAVMLNARLVQPKIGWAAFILMAGGALMTNIMVMLGEADVMFTAYVPLKAHPLFYLGIVLFAVGALIAVILFFATVITAKRERRYEGSAPLVTYGLIAAAIIAVYTLLSGALAFVPALLWSLDWIPPLDPGYYRNLFWGFGHPAQQINLAAMVAIWYALAAITVGAVPLNEKLSRLAFILYVLFINLGSAHHLLTDPGYSFLWKVTNTSYAMYLAVLGSLIHAFSIPGAVEAAQRRKGYTKSLFEWIRKAPWREPGFSALVISMVLFGWIGGVTGVTIGTEQVNMLAHNTMRLPGHFHATVVSGTTLAFMGLTYYLIPLIFRRELKLKSWASRQPYVFGFGMLLVSIGMIASGLQGVPRRHWDITFASSTFKAFIPSTAEFMLGIMGIGAIIAIVGGVMYLTVVLTSVLTGKRQEARRLTLVMSQENPLVDDAIPANGKEATGKIAPKGTVVLVFGFLMFFVIYYFSNWWLLGRTWMIN